MAKQKRLVSFTDKHFEMLESIMKEDGQESVSFVLGGFIANEWKAREEVKNKRKQGRPRKEDNDEVDELTPDDDAYWNDDLPKDKVWYNKSVGSKELYYLENRKIEMPPN